MIRPKIAVVVSHPIQHFCPMYASWADNERWNLKVFFASTTGVKKYYDTSFNKEVTWNRLYLDKFDHVFLNDNRLLDINTDLDAPEIENLLAEYNPNIIIVYGYTQKLQIRTRNWANKNNITVLMISDSELRHHRSWYIRLLKKIIIPQKLKRFSGFLTVGDANEEYYLHYGVERNKLYRLPFPIDIKLYENALRLKDQLRKEIRARYLLGNNDIVLATVGKLLKYKRQIDIIKALQYLEQNDRNIVLFIIGSGGEYKKLKSAAHVKNNNSFIFTGFISPEELPAYYAATDIYIHPSEKDAHSLSISEAIFMGCPAIVSDRCGSYGPSDDVRPNENGFVFPARNIKTLRQLIIKLSLNDQLRNRFSKNSIIISSLSQSIAHRNGLIKLLNNLNIGI